MRKIFVVAGRDYRAAVKTKSFLISLLIMPLMMGGSILVQLLLKDKVDITDKHFAIIDRTGGALAAQLQAAVTKRNSKEILDKEGKQTKPRFILETVESIGDRPKAIDQVRYELSEKVRKQELFGFLEIGPDVAKFQPGVKTPEATSVDDEPRDAVSPTDDSHVVRYQSNSATYNAFENWARGILNKEVQRARFEAARVNLPQPELQELLRPVTLVAKGLSSRDPATGEIEEAPDENLAASFGLPGGMMFLMFMLVLVGATPLMQAVVEEKMQRIAEVLLGSIRPFELMLGKLLGMVGVSLTLAAVYLGGAYWA